jgi:hypothetical protein
MAGPSNIQVPTYSLKQTNLLSKMSTIDQITALIGELSFAEKLTINEQLASSLRKEGKESKGKKVEDKDKPKRKAALGTLAWGAYVKHIKMTQPDAFEGITKESEKLVIIKGIRAEDSDGYTSFTEAWKKEHTPVIDDEVEEPAPKVKTTVKTAAKPAVKAEKVKTTVKAEKVKPAKSSAKKAEKPKEEPYMPQLEVDGNTYWHDPSSNGLWEVTGETIEDGTGSWIGYYQPGNDEEPIRFTEAFGSD